jgi:hypothetical protein
MAAMPAGASGWWDSMRVVGWYAGGQRVVGPTGGMVCGCWDGMRVASGWWDGMRHAGVLAGGGGTSRVGIAVVMAAVATEWTSSGGGSCWAAAHAPSAALQGYWTNGGEKAVHFFTIGAGAAGPLSE